MHRDFVSVGRQEDLAREQHPCLSANENQDKCVPGSYLLRHRGGRIPPSHAFLGTGNYNELLASVLLHYVFEKHPTK